MGTGGAPQAAIVAAGRAAAATLLFRAGDRLRVAVVVKATFIMAQDGPMLQIAPEPIVVRDRHHGDDPARSVVAASDLVPYRPRADVLLTGHARAPVGSPAARVGLRVMLARGRDLLLDKRLVAQGPPGPGGQPTPFESLPLVYENAARSADNPVGVREGAAPGIVDRWYRPAPVGFGPIDRRWPAPARLLPQPEVLAAPVPALPAQFPWEYFHAAPDDQRIDFLQGDEWVGFEGMNSQIPRVQSYLPGVRGVAQLYGPEPGLAAGRPIALAADTLAIDADRLQVSVVWRGSFAVSSEAALTTLRVVAGVESAAEPLALPASYEAALTPGPAPAAQQDDVVDTLDVPADAEVRGAAMPFPPQDPLPPRSRPLPRATPFDRIPAVTVQPAGSSRPPGDDDDADEPPSTTLDLPPEAAARVRAGAEIPFAAGTQPPRPPPSRPLPWATPFDRIPAAAVQPSPSPVPETLSEAEPMRTTTLDLPADIVAQVRAAAGMPFAPTAPLPPRPPSDRPLPPATPFELHAEAPAPPPPLPPPVLHDGPAEPTGGEPAGEPAPKTLGQHFLSALARARRAPARRLHDPVSS